MTPEPFAVAEHDALRAGDAEFEAGGDPPRQFDEMRAISFERGVSKHAEGSCLVKFGDTHVLCTASLEEKVPGWLLDPKGPLVIRPSYALSVAPWLWRFRKNATLERVNAIADALHSLLDGTVVNVDETVELDAVEAAPVAA